MKSSRTALATLVVLLPLAPLHINSRVGPEADCTPKPALYENWKSTTQWARLPDSTIRRQVERLRSRVMFDPFDSVIVGDSAARARLNERVLWEDDSVIVIFAKPPIPRDALIVPKREMMFPTDASESVLISLATVAAARLPMRLSRVRGSNAIRRLPPGCGSIRPRRSASGTCTSTYSLQRRS
jgi:hypothetical protein